MAGSPKTVVVDVILKLGQNPPFAFRSTDLTVGPDNTLTFANNGHPGFMVEYRLQEPTHDYRFPDNPIPNYKKKALYSAEGACCPNKEGQWQQFETHNVKDGGKTLVVRNRNQCQAQFGYTLRVTNDGGAKYLDLDPGGFNQNGPQQLSAWSYVAVGVAGAVAGSLITLGAQALLDN